MKTKFVHCSCHRVVVTLQRRVEYYYHADEVFHYRFSVRLNLERHDIFVMWLRTAMIEVTIPAQSLKIFVGITPLTTTALLQMKAVVTFCCEI